MSRSKRIPLSYFPGCSMATTAKENNRSLIEFCERIGYDLIEVPDWNCCGSSSAHSVDAELAQDLAARNLTLAPKGRPLLAACPNCMLRLRGAQRHLAEVPDAQQRCEARWGRPVDPNLKLIHFFDLLAGADMKGLNKTSPGLKGMKFVPYYGCMLARPPAMRHEPNHHGLMEKILSDLGAEPRRWGYGARCCGTFLSVVRPDVVGAMVDAIFRNAAAAGADCLVTACAMCHMNLEVRSTLQNRIPVLHFSEALALAVGEGNGKDWFSRHLVDPRPLLRSARLIA